MSRVRDYHRHPHISIRPKASNTIVKSLTSRLLQNWGEGGSTERLYKPPMNPYVVSSCLRASLRFSYATHVFAYVADSQHVELARRLRVGIWSVSPQQLLTRAPFLMQPPELFKMMYPEEEDCEELPSSSSFSGLALCSYCKSRNGFCGSDIHLEGKRAAELSELTRLRTPAYAPEPL